MNSYENTYSPLKIPLNCRNGPAGCERRCTDLLCCIFYLLLISSIIFLGLFSKQAPMMSE